MAKHSSGYEVTATSTPSTATSSDFWHDAFRRECLEKGLLTLADIVGHDEQRKSA